MAKYSRFDEIIYNPPRNGDQYVARYVIIDISPSRYRLRLIKGDDERDGWVDHTVLDDEAYISLSLKNRLKQL